MPDEVQDLRIQPCEHPGELVARWPDDELRVHVRQDLRQRFVDELDLLLDVNRHVVGLGTDKHDDAQRPPVLRLVRIVLVVVADARENVAGVGEHPHVLAPCQLPWKRPQLIVSDLQQEAQTFLGLLLTRVASAQLRPPLADLALGEQTVQIVADPLEFSLGRQRILAK